MQFAGDTYLDNSLNSSKHKLSLTNSYISSNNSFSRCSLGSPWLAFNCRGSLNGSLACYHRLKIFRIIIMFPNGSFIDPLWQLIITLEVTKTGWPRISIMRLYGFATDWILRTMKLIRKWTLKSNQYIINFSYRLSHLP